MPGDADRKVSSGIKDGWSGMRAVTLLCGGTGGREGGREGGEGEEGGEAGGRGHVLSDAAAATRLC